MEKIFDQWNKLGIRYVFRTSIDADVLYRFRQQAKSIKLIETTFNNKHIIIFRDQIQGFYSIDERKYYDNSMISFKSHFSEYETKEFLDFVWRKSKEAFQCDFKLHVIYKFHLFEGYLEPWVKSFFKNKKILPRIVQPDTGITDFLDILMNDEKGNYVFAVGNEIGDIIHEFVLKLEGKIFTKLFLFSRNYYLNYNDILVYQTVHGSADDKSSNEICPIATIRIASHILSNILNTKIIFLYTNSVVKDVVLKYIHREHKSDFYLVHWEADMVLDNVLNELLLRISV